jgi:hypothetical protein
MTGAVYAPVQSGEFGLAVSLAAWPWERWEVMPRFIQDAGAPVPASLIRACEHHAGYTRDQKFPQEF